MANFINITEIKKGDRIKAAFKDEDSECDEIFFKELTVESVNLIEKCVITEDGSKMYGSYNGNSYFNLIK